MWRYNVNTYKHKIWYYIPMGRKPVERVAVAWKLPVETARQIEELAKAEGVTKTRIVVVAVRNLWRSWQRRGKGGEGPSS